MNKVATLALVSNYPENPGEIKGGVESVTVNLANTLKKVSKLDIHIIAPTEKKHEAIEERESITIHWVPVSRLPGFLSYWTVYRSKVHKVLECINPDMTHFQGVAGWSLGYKKPFVLTIHGIGERDALYSVGAMPRLRSKIIGAIERQARQSCNDVIVINPYIIEEIGAQIIGKKWHIANPISSDYFDIESSGFLRHVLYVGRINSRKNIDGLIRAFKQVHQQYPDSKLRIAGPKGDSAYHGECESLIRELELGDSVTFLGLLNKRELSQELSNASCLALVSKQETAPMVVSEAMAAGVPVVATNGFGLPYMIEHGVSGYLVDSDDEVNIAKAISSVISNEQTNSQLSGMSRKIAFERFHEISVAEKTLELYRTILSTLDWGVSDGIQSDELLQSRELAL